MKKLAKNQALSHGFWLNEEGVCMNNIAKKAIAWIVFFNLVLSLTGCYQARESEYYSNEENFISVTGTVIHYSDDTENGMLFLAFSDLSYNFDAIDFKIVDKNYEIVMQNGIADKVEMGTKVEFVTAPRLFGDGYTMPIVALTVNGEVLLEYEEGYPNFMNWQKQLFR